MGTMTAEVINSHDLKTASHPEVQLCTDTPGLEHSFRPVQYTWLGRIKTSMRCVFCHGVMCGDIRDPDPCVEVYHHTEDHRTARGKRWRIGGNRPA
jgi:hypothetical protein